MESFPRIVLRYFDARGRAQFMRYYLTARNIPFEDERVPLSGDFSEWRAIRDDTAVTGWFKKLPVLHYGEESISETLVIASLLHERLGDAQALSAEENLRHAMLRSSLYGDVLYLLGVLLWGDVMYRGVNRQALAAQTLDRVRRHLETVDATLDEWRWLERLGSRETMLADCLLWDQLRNASDLFGAHLRLNELETLRRFYETCPARDRFEALLESHPCPITGRPGEAEAIEKLKEHLDSPPIAAA